MAISYLLCLERDGLDVHVSWTTGWTIFWDEKHITSIDDLLSPVVLLVCYIFQLLNEGQERQNQVVIFHQSTSRGSFLLVSDGRFLQLCLKGKDKITFRKTITFNGEGEP